MSVPNQYIVKIHKHKYERDFLQIGIDEWLEASKVLSKSEFQFYLYLAGNRDNYNLELSRKYVMEKLDICERTYKSLVSGLRKAGYLVETSSNHLSFYTTPQKSVNGVKNCPNTNGVKNCPNDETVNKITPVVGNKIAPSVGNKITPEIDKTDKIDRELDNPSSLTSRCLIPMFVPEEVKVDGEISRETADMIIEKEYISPTLIQTATGKIFKITED